MASVGRILSNEIRCSLQNLKSLLGKDCRRLSSQAAEKTEPSKDSKERKSNAKDGSQDRKVTAPLHFRFLYPEFLPDPNPEWRNPVREKLERMDMMARRARIDIPTFYVGSILAVTHSDLHAPGKSNRFVGICIHRSGCGLRARFILRNVVDHQGVEVNYDLYDPTIQEIQCLKLEKRLDDELFYLRDAPLEYSTFPFDMKPEYLPDGSPVLINELRVPLKPRPWLERWERKELKGVRDLDIDERRRKRAEAAKKPWEKFDLMKEYRATIPMEEQQDIFAEVYSDLHQQEITRRQLKRKRTFNRPTKSA